MYKIYYIHYKIYTKLNIIKTSINKERKKGYNKRNLFKWDL